jgi:hypothetical protein
MEEDTKIYVGNMKNDYAGCIFKSFNTASQICYSGNAVIPGEMNVNKRM